MNESDEIVEAFLDESRENLDQLDVDLVQLETSPSDPELLAQVFRTIHTIKGTCGFLGYQRLETLTHAGENLLGALRAGDLVLDASVTTSLLRLVDAVRLVLDRVATTGSDGEEGHDDLVAELARHLTEPDAGPVSAGPLSSGPVSPGSVSAGPLLAGARERLAGHGEVAVTASVSESHVRIEVAILDRLMELTGELVLARSQFGELARLDEDGPLARPYRQLRLVTAEFQEAVMGARLQPVGAVTGKFRRIARDLAAALGKQVRVELVGEDVGVDKAVNEALRDPLLHLVRNAVDHAIESPAQRLASGKPPEGVIRIAARHDGGRIRVEVSDDGRGVDTALLVQRAVSTGVLGRDEADALSEPQALELMFRAGLSSREEVTNVSGRGVGMDVVRANLDGVGGSIDVSSRPGAGTTFQLNVPLTLAIMPVVVAWCRGHPYSVNQTNVREVVHLEPSEMAASIDAVDGARVLRLRGRLLSLVDLGAQMQLDGAPPPAPDCFDSPDRAGATGLLIIVVESGGARFGLIVEEVGETLDVVVRPLTRATRSIPIFAGVTVLVDGRPSLILDVAALAARAGIRRTVDDDDAAPVKGSDQVVGGEGAIDLLLADALDGSRVGIHLDVVSRLEQFARADLERAGPVGIVYYRDGILPLVPVPAPGPVAAIGPLPPDAPGSDVVNAVICTSSVGAVGLVVDRIDDVVAHPIAAVVDPDAQARARLQGLGGRRLVDRRITQVLDVEALVAAAGLTEAP
jgi:two-component system chemotaxis sensor kinase CheA